MSIKSNEIEKLKYELGLKNFKKCASEASNQYYAMKQAGERLPDNIVEDSEFPYKFYEVGSHQPTESDLDLLIKLRQLSYIKTIKNCLIFIVTIIALQWAFGIVSLLASL